ncbi:MAG: hypothetical protein JO063_02155 [Pseudonocardiales bacterium]|nr:hypothetical protein [Pseudonocardiales bacterium]MBW0008917.1 hypothetical protein [Pseudonocardiales bacterium]
MPALAAIVFTDESGEGDDPDDEDDPTGPATSNRWLIGSGDAAQWDRLGWWAILGLNQ